MLAVDNCGFRPHVALLNMNSKAISHLLLLKVATQSHIDAWELWHLDWRLLPTRAFGSQREEKWFSDKSNRAPLNNSRTHEHSEASETLMQPKVTIARG